MASGAAVAKRRRSPAAFGYAHPWLRAVGLLLPAVGAFGFFYLAALAVLFVSAFWTVDAFTGQLVHHWTTSNFRTLRTVILPLALPGLVAGSIFPFSLTLGDYITPVLIGGASSQFIGNVVYDAVNQSSNLPFGAAFAVVPVLVMGVYLAIARRLGAFDAL